MRSRWPNCNYKGLQNREKIMLLVLKQLRKQRKKQVKMEKTARKELKDE